MLTWEKNEGAQVEDLTLECIITQTHKQNVSAHSQEALANWKRRHLMLQKESTKIITGIQRWSPHFIIMFISAGSHSSSLHSSTTTWAQKVGKMHGLFPISDHSSHVVTGWTVMPQIRKWAHFSMAGWAGGDMYRVCVWTGAEQSMSLNLPSTTGSSGGKEATQNLMDWITTHNCAFCTEGVQVMY